MKEADVSHEKRHFIDRIVSADVASCFKSRYRRVADLLFFNRHTANANFRTSTDLICRVSHGKLSLSLMNQRYKTIILFLARSCHAQRSHVYLPKAQLRQSDKTSFT
jgi:hypothetical protein